MRKVYNKCGVTCLCCLVVVLSSCSKNEKKESSSNYVIQEIITPATTDTSQIVEATPLPPIVENSDELVDSTYGSINPMDSKKALERLGSVVNPDSTEVVDYDTVDLINSNSAKSIVKVFTANAATLSECFNIQNIPVSVYQRMEHKSYSEGCTTTLSDLRYVRVLHYGFDGEVHIGELVVNKLIAEDIVDIFKELFDAKYPIKQMVLIDDYDADDHASMAANNTSCFNFRVVEGTEKLSNHAYGLAIDINPLFNPYVHTVDGEEVIEPDNGKVYADRNLDCTYYIEKDDVLYNAFISRGFTWGGDWTSSKDYQHFQKVIK